MFGYELSGCGFESNCSHLKTTECSLDYRYFKEYYEMIAIDLRKQQKLDAEPKPIQQTNFIRNLDRNENTTMFSIIEVAKDNVYDFSQGTIVILCCNFILL